MSTTVGANTLSFTATSLSPGSHTSTVTAVNSLGQSVASVRTFTVAAPTSDVVTVDRGTWNDQTTYAFDDHVSYSGQTWYVVSRTGVTGVTPGTDSTRWGTAVAA